MLLYRQVSRHLARSIRPLILAVKGLNSAGPACRMAISLVPNLKLGETRRHVKGSLRTESVVDKTALEKGDRSEMTQPHVLWVAPARSQTAT
jgi:hypothetical protein